ncbi:hypothetical protein IWZ00DRAFT_129302 [Phyllosticta capitalensis]
MSQQPWASKVPLQNLSEKREKKKKKNCWHAMTGLGGLGGWDTGMDDWRAKQGKAPGIPFVRNASHPAVRVVSRAFVRCVALRSRVSTFAGVVFLSLLASSGNTPRRDETKRCKTSSSGGGVNGWPATEQQRQQQKTTTANGNNRWPVHQPSSQHSSPVPLDGEAPSVCVDVANNNNRTTTMAARPRVLPCPCHSVLSLVGCTAARCGPAQRAGPGRQAANAGTP